MSDKYLIQKLKLLIKSLKEVGQHVTHTHCIPKPMELLVIIADIVRTNWQLIVSQKKKKKTDN